MENKVYRIKLSNAFYGKLCILLAVAAVVLLIFNILQVRTISNISERKIAELKESVRPAEIKLVTITTESCKNCFDPDELEDIVTASGVNVTEKRNIDFLSEEAKKRIAYYGIERLPAVIVTGELEKAKSLKAKAGKSGKAKNNAYIFEAQRPLFLDTEGRIIGEISATILENKDCQLCPNVEDFVDKLKLADIVVSEKRNIDMNSTEGKALIEKYSIKKLPVVIFNKEIEVYPELAELADRAGTKEGDGNYIIRDLNLPYYIIENNSLFGLVKMAVLYDENCKDCYDAKALNTPILKSMGVAISETDNIERSREKGREFIRKYNITKLPTIILTGDVEAYPELVNAWKQVGSKETDGSYVFRAVEFAKKPYMDLAFNRTVNPVEAGNSVT